MRAAGAAGTRRQEGWFVSALRGGFDESVPVLIREAVAGSAGLVKGVGVDPHAGVVGLVSRQGFPSGPT